MRCTGCKRGFYCSKECQKRDWEVAHKGCCKFLKKINEIEAEESATCRSWEEYRDSLVGITSPF
jgi:splicing suppressor protein 51